MKICLKIHVNKLIFLQKQACERVELSSRLGRCGPPAGAHLSSLRGSQALAVATTNSHL